MLTGSTAALSWGSIWCKAYKRKCECKSWRCILRGLRAEASVLGCYKLKLHFRTMSTSRVDRHVLLKKLEATALSMAFGAIVVGVSGTVLILQTSLCSMLASANHDFNSTHGLKASSWCGQKLTQEAVNCGRDLGSGLTSTFPRHIHIILIPRITVLMAIQATAAWSRASIMQALGQQKEQQQQSQAMLRWLSHECRSPAAAAILTLEVVQEGVLPRLRGTQMTHKQLV